VMTREVQSKDEFAVVLVLPSVSREGAPLAITPWLREGAALLERLFGSARIGLADRKSGDTPLHLRLVASTTTPDELNDLALGQLRHFLVNFTNLIPSDDAGIVIGCHFYHSITVPSEAT
jgi:hypothetical protein